MKNKTQKWYYGLRNVLMMFLLVLSLTGCQIEITVPDDPASGQSGNGSSFEAVEGTDLRVHFIDVDQGDSILIESAGHFMLVDAGERDQKENVISYLKSQGVKKLDYLIGTHPHSDHIGSLEAVVREFPVETVIMPEKEHTTKVFENLLDAIADRGLSITLPEVGDTYQIGSAGFTIIAPNTDYADDLNNWSVGIRLVYGENSFVLCGDAEKGAEKDICSNGQDISADVLKLSHHGSSTSSSDLFMDHVNPEYAVISCGKDNDYGFPHRENKQMLKKRNIKTYRTDELGTIVVTSDGKNLTFADESGILENGEGKGSEDLSVTYVFNVNTKKFHRPDCTSVVNMKKENREDFTGTREEAVKMGYEPCQSCKP